NNILQSLDLAPFSVHRSKYCEQIQELPSLNDAAPVKKEHFVVSYNKAKEEALSEWVI
ncbi:hypothetical protein BU25DRAFT_333203, partial [Macroventuria anomochaeta]